MPLPSQDVTDFSIRSIMPAEDVLLIEAERPGFLDAAIKGARHDLYARLRKRYKVPFDPEPEIFVQWISRLVTPIAYRARGTNPQDPTITVLEEERKNVYAEVREAVDAKDGLYDLPLVPEGDASGISKGGPLGYSEPSPYDWLDRQAEALRGR